MVRKFNMENRSPYRQHGDLFSQGFLEEGKLGQWRTEMAGMCKCVRMKPVAPWDGVAGSIIMFSLDSDLPLRRVMSPLNI
jgi:hypothetical protein